VRLRHRLTVERATETQDAVGSVTKGWGSVATPYGDIKPLRGQERFIAQQTAAEVSHRILMRHDSDTSGITARDRVTLDGRVFELLAVLNVDERDRVLECLAVERL